MSVYYEFESVESFTTGAVGQPGSRTFFLQARQGRSRVAIKCEKQQVAAMATHIRRALNDLPPAEDRPLPAALEFAVPVDESFVLGQIGLGYDRATDRIVVQLEEFGERDDEGEAVAGHDGHVRLYLTRGQAAAFCDRAEQVVAAGRPDCSWCGYPIDPAGHACPRMN